MLILSNIILIIIGILILIFLSYELYKNTFRNSKYYDFYMNNKENKEMNSVKLHHKNINDDFIYIMSMKLNPVYDKHLGYKYEINFWYFKRNIFKKWVYVYSDNTNYTYYTIEKSDLDNKYIFENKINKITLDFDRKNGYNYEEQKIQREEIIILLEKMMKGCDTNEKR